jgi:hypothetical protein
MLSHYMDTFHASDESVREKAWRSRKRVAQATRARSPAQQASRTHTLAAAPGVTAHSYACMNRVMNLGAQWYGAFVVARLRVGCDLADLQQCPSLLPLLMLVFAAVYH